MVVRELNTVRKKKENLGRLCVSVQGLLVETYRDHCHAFLSELGVNGGWDGLNTDTLYLLLVVSSCHGKVGV